MNNIVVGSQVTAPQSLGQPFLLSSNAHLASGITPVFPIQLTDQEQILGLVSEVEKSPLRLNGIYCSDVSHPHSSPLHDNNDDSNANPLPLQSPSLILPNDEDLNDSHPQNLTSPQSHAEDPDNKSSGAGLIGVPLPPVCLFPLAESFGGSDRGEVVQCGDGQDDEAGLMAGDGCGAGQEALQTTINEERGRNLENANCINTADGETRSASCKNPIIQLQVGIDSGDESRVVVAGESGAASGNSQAPGAILTQNCQPEPNSTCGVGQGSHTASSGAAASGTLNIQFPKTAISQKSETYNNPCLSTVSSAPVILSSIPHLIEPELYIPRHFSSLNRADLEEVRRHQDMLDGYQMRLLKMVKDKIALHPQRYGRDNYHQTATFLILSDWPSAEKLAFCGIPSKANRSGRCCLHQFCPYCCWRVRNKAQLTYVPSFYEGTWHWLTGSFDGELGFTGSDGFDWLHYWDAYKHGLEELIEERLIDGAYWTEELAVNALLPVRVLPHVHCVIDAHDLTDSTIESLKEKVNAYLVKHLGPDVLQPNIKTTPIDDQKSLFTRIGYMNKTVKLLRSYEEGWVGASFHNRFRAWELNSQLTDLIKGHAEITRRRPKMKSKGTLNPRDKRFIGIKTKDHKKREHQELINELKKQPTEFIQENEQDDNIFAVTE